MTQHYTLADRLLSRPFLDTQPGWSRMLYWLVGIPLALIWGFLLLSDDDRKYPVFTVVVGVISIVLGTIQTVLYLRNKKRITADG